MEEIKEIKRYQNQSGIDHVMGQNFEKKKKTASNDFQ